MNIIKKKVSLICAVVMSIFLSTAPNTNSFAQVIDNANNNNANSLQLCNGTTCPGAFLSNTITPPKVLNADMATIESNGTSTNALPAAWGTTVNDYIFGIVYSGANSPGPMPDLVDASGLVIKSSINATTLNMPLPSPYTLLTGPANDPDVAVGTYVDVSGISKHFALVVYENNGHIYLEHFDVNVSTTSSNTYPPVPGTPPPPFCPPACPAITSNNPVLLSQMTAGRAYKPHIEIWHDTNIPVTGAIIYADRYAVTWEVEGLIGSGTEVWGIDGPIDVVGQWHPPTPNNTDFFIDDGKQPDVVAVTAVQPQASHGILPDYAYVTYLSDNGDDVKLSRWSYNTISSVVNLPNLNTNTTAGPDEFYIPRISGPAYYDFGMPSPGDPLAVVVVNDNDGNSPNLFDKVSSFKYYEPSLPPPPVVEKLDISDYNSLNGFSSNSYTAVMPAVTGVGEIVYGLAALTAYDDYPTVFYSDHTNNIGTYASSGDFYSFGINPAINITNPNLTTMPPNGYWEVNYPEIQENQAYSLFDHPAVAVATSNNTGYDLLTVFYGGTNAGAYQNNIVYSITGTANKYDFKPGKTTGVTDIDEDGYAIYPNPVTTQLNIKNADGAIYEIMDITGRTLSTGTLSGSEASVNTASFAAGMYIINITKDEQTEKVKFVKQ